MSLSLGRMSPSAALSILCLVCFIRQAWLLKAKSGVFAGSLQIQSNFHAGGAIDVDFCLLLFLHGLHCLLAHGYLNTQMSF